MAGDDDIDDEVVVQEQQAAAAASQKKKQRPVAWKHIGLYGHAVGTFTADPSGITWKSAVMAGGDDVETRRVIPLNCIAGALWSVFGKSGHLRIVTKSPSDGAKNKLPSEYRFDGFPHSDHERLSEALRSFFGVALKRHGMSAAGSSWGNTDISNRHLVFRQCVLEDAEEEGEEFEPRDGDEMMSLDLGEVSQCVLPGNNRNEIEMQFLESDTVEAGTDSLVAIRFYVPPDQDADPTDNDAPTPAEVLQDRMMKIASVKKTSGSIIAEFDESKGTFLTPRGRYSIELYDSFLRMRGAKYDYKIKYDDISRLFLLPKQDDAHTAFVIALDKPIRQGQQRYQMLVMQCTKEQSELTINLDEKILLKEYGGELQAIMHGSFSNLVAKTFKVITKKKVFIPGKFANANQQACVKCALRANEGHLYPLEKQFIFIHKPAVLIRFDEVESVEFQRYARGQGSTRNFDLCVSLHDTPGDNLSTKEYTFSGIDKTNYAALYSFLSGKKIRIKNIEGVGDEPPVRGSLITNYDETEADAAEMGEESSEDEDYDVGAGSGEESSGDESDVSSVDDDELGSMSEDSDIAEHRKAAGLPEKKKKEKVKSEKSGGDGGGGDREEGKKKQKKKEKDKKSTASAGDGDDDNNNNNKKRKKDPNAPKKPLSGYMFFLSAKRKQIKEDTPDATFGEISKLVSKEFKALTDEQKEKWEGKAKEDKKRYAKDMETYTPPEGSEAPPKKKAKKDKDPNAPKRPMNSYMLYSNSVRSQIREENPEMPTQNIMKEISNRFKLLNEEDQKKWKDKADKVKEVYKKDVEAYEKTKPKEKKQSSMPKAKVNKPEPQKKPAASSSDESRIDPGMCDPVYYSW